MSLITVRRQARRNPDGLNHALRIRPSFARLAERRAVIDGNPDDGQAAGDVDSGHRTPCFGALIVLKADDLRGNMSLVVIHGHDQIILPALHL